jgi:hypothetical protein
VEIVLALTNIEMASACSADRIKSASASSQSEMGLRTRKLIAIVVAVSSNPPDARGEEYKYC